MLKKTFKKLFRLIKKILSFRRVGGTTKNFLKWFNRQQEVDVTQLLNWVDDINQGWIIITSRTKSCISISKLRNYCLLKRIQKY